MEIKTIKTIKCPRCLHRWDADFYPSHDCERARIETAIFRNRIHDIIIIVLAGGLIWFIVYALTLQGFISFMQDTTRTLAGLTEKSVKDSEIMFSAVDKGK